MVFDFIENVFEDVRQYYAFEKIERLRTKLLKDEKTIKMVDFGAGSKTNNAKEKKVREIAATSLTNKQFGEILFKLVSHYKPKTILELGTSLGLATTYLAMPSPETSRLITLEGNPGVAKVAAANFEAFHLKNIELIEGQFEQTLATVLNKVDQLDLVFFDGNHQKAPTLAYFEACLAKAHEDSIFVFDDIYWSSGMTAAWKELKLHASVSHSIDIFQFGLLFFKKNMDKPQHTQLIEHKWKPWSAGFFK